MIPETLLFSASVGAGSLLIVRAFDRARETLNPDRLNRAIFILSISTGVSGIVWAVCGFFKLATKRFDLSELMWLVTGFASGITVALLICSSVKRPKE